MRILAWSREERLPVIDLKAIRPLAEDGDTVLQLRADYEVLVRASTRPTSPDP